MLAQHIAQSTQCIHLNLPDPLASQTNLAAYLLQSFLLVVLQAKAPDPCYQ